jgi:hypothetical protein
VQDVVIETPAGKFHSKRVRNDRNGNPATAWLSKEVPGLGVARVDLANGSKMVAMKIGHDGESTFPVGVEPKTTMFGPDSQLGQALATMKDNEARKGDAGLMEGTRPTNSADAGATPPGLKPYGLDAGR